MAILTIPTQNALLQNNIEPKVILQIDGLSTVYGSGQIKEIARIGETLDIGEFIIGGFVPIEGQEDLISFDSSTVRIGNQLRPDKGNSESVTSMRLRMIDQDNKITQLITAGQLLTDLLFTRCKVWVGFGDSTAYPDDYLVLFRGYIDQINAGQGYVDFNISNTDQKKRQSLFVEVDTKLTAAINNSVTSIEIDSAVDCLVVPIDPSTGAQSTYLKTYIQINDEIIQYTGKGAAGAGPGGGTVLTGCVRGQLSTAAASHSLGDEVVSYYVLEDNSMYMALRLMLSNKDQSSYVTVNSTNVNQLTATEFVANSFYFPNSDVEFLHNVQIGDYVTSSGFTNGANNLATKTEILNVEQIETGSYITVNATLTTETDTSGDIVFHSQYNVLGEGLGMVPEEVDIDAHITLYNRFLSSASLKFYFKETKDDFKTWIAEQIYFPYACYEVNRFSRSSVNYTIGPIPTDTLITLNDDTIINPSTLILERSVGRNFYNTIVHKMDEVITRDEDTLTRALVTINEDSKNRISYGTKALEIKANGLRESLGGKTQALIASNRMLNRYKFASESLKNVKVSFSTGIKLDVGDIVLLDSTNLNIANTISGNREKPSSFFEVVNKNIDIRTGDVKLELVDTNFSTQNRYGLISPSSVIKSGISQTKFIIDASYNTSRYGVNEYRKWEPYVTKNYKAVVKVRSVDSSVIASAGIANISGNTITLDTALGFTPASGYIMELATYNLQVDELKLIYVHMTDSATFDDGQDQYKQL